jgi:hypothetical protein
MTTKRYLLPATATSSEAQMNMLADLVREHCRQDLVTTGWTEDVYPNEQGWIDLPNNQDSRRRVFYAVVGTRRRKRSDRDTGNGAGR